MKDYSQEELERTRPSINPNDAIECCLKALFEDKKHNIHDYVVDGLTYEEVIGALLLANDRFLLDEKEG